MIPISQVEFHPITAVKKRLLDGLNWISFTQGPPGCGKSETDLGIGCQIDPDLLIGETVCFDVRKYVEAMRNKQVRVVIFDDSGFGLNSRKFQSQDNIIASVIAQTCRVLQKATLVNSPDISFTDISIRKLIHTLIEPTKIDRASGCNVVKWLNVSYSPRNQQIYYRYPTIRYAGEFCRATRVSIPRAPVKLVHEYEKLKMEFVDKILADAESKLAAKITKTVEQSITPEGIAKQIYASEELRKATMVLQKDRSFKPDRDLISIHFKVGRTRAGQVAKLLQQMMTQQVEGENA